MSELKNVYVSTGGFRGITAAEASRMLSKAGIKFIELSGGVHSATLLESLRAFESDIHFQVHNYFPPPIDPFVLNLGSLDESIGRRSVTHMEQALQWCSILGATRYSFHAGFLLDPKVDDLGRRIPVQTLFDRDKCIEVFVHRVLHLSKLAKKKGVTLMVENNVLSAKNASEFSSNPLLMCDPKECHQIMKLLPKNVGLLVDVAHLKVSANSLNFEPSSLFDVCDGRVAGYHLSDNDGREDSNMAFREDAWFFPYLNSNLDYYTVEVYGCSPAQLFEQVNLIRKKLH